MNLSRAAAFVLLATTVAQAQVMAPPGPPPVVAGPVVVPAQTWVAPAADDNAARGWLEAEYLLWWLKGQPVPLPLVSSAPAGSAAVFPGAIGNADTAVLLGNQTIDGPERHGFRIGGGAWLSDRFGIDGSYFKLVNQTASRTFASSGAADSAFIALPYINPTTTGEESALAAAPGVFSGLVGLTFETRLQGADLNAAFRVGCGGRVQTEVLAGFRWLSLDERLNLNGFAAGVPGGPIAGVEAVVSDRFETRNDFYGGQLGARVRADFDRFFGVLTAKVALGVVNENVRVNGERTDTIPPAGPVTVPGGFYTQPTNIGSRTRERFAVVPEVGLKVGYRLTDSIFATVGYNFLYISEVARPGHTIDRNINTTQIAGFPLAGPARPMPVLRDDSFFAHGLTVSLGFQF